MKKDVRRVREIVTNENKCILANVCSLAGTESCTNLCEHYVSIHGYNDNGGRVRSAQIPLDYRTVTLQNSPARENQSRLYATLERYAETFKRRFTGDSEPIKSAYLYSKNPGTGKTTSAVALLNEWVKIDYMGSIKYGKRPSMLPAYFLDVNEFQTKHNLATMTSDEKELEEIKDVINICRNVEFLVMDDIGLRNATDSFRSYVHAIVNHRTTYGKPTVYTSNLPIEDMASVFDERLYDRMNDRCVQLHFKGESNRGGI